MIQECCQEEKNYQRFFAMLAARIILLNPVYKPLYEQSFHETYFNIHTFETNKIRNCAKFYAHLLYQDSIGWTVMHDIKLTEEDTVSANRIFVKILFQELHEHLGSQKLV